MTLPTIGKKAPDFTTTDQDGHSVTLSKLKGQKVVLYFYPKDDTPTCTKQACNLRYNYNHLLKKGYSVFGISPDNEKSHTKFRAKFNLPFSLLSDLDKTINEKYGVWVEKSMYGRKYMGTARTTFLIDEKGVVSEVITAVDSANHTAQILGEETKKAKSIANKKVAATKKKVPAKAKQ